MPQPRRRRHRDRSPSHAPEAAASAQPSPSRAPGAGWKWRTFPVYFAFALGAFVGVYAGFFSASLNSGAGYWVLVAVSLLLGLGLSRLLSRWLVYRRIIRPRPQRASR